MQTPAFSFYRNSPATTGGWPPFAYFLVNFCRFQPIHRKNGTNMGTNQDAFGERDDAAVFDRASSLEQIGGDPDLLAALVTAHLEQEPRLLKNFDDAVVSGDVVSIRKTAHALASSVSVLCAGRARAAAKEVEAMGLRCELTDVEAGRRAVHEEFSRLRLVLCGPGNPKAP